MKTTALHAPLLTNAGYFWPRRGLYRDRVLAVVEFLTSDCAGLDGARVSIGNALEKPRFPPPPPRKKKTGGGFFFPPPDNKKRAASKEGFKAFQPT